MLLPSFFIDLLREKEFEFFTGVPDSLLKSVCAYIKDNFDVNHNIIATNEGAAVGLATGYYLATGKFPVVYMQNSGLGNCVNPLTSLIDKEVYNIPMLLLIGWRGEPNVKDEPQHIKQGKITLPLLATLDIQNVILSDDPVNFQNQLTWAYNYISLTNEPFAFVVKKGTFDDYKLKSSYESVYSMSREDAIKKVASALPENAVIISTTGMISRELFEYREEVGQSHNRDFLTVGSMGHASQIALGIALMQPCRKVYCFDGDGAVLMHMGSLATNATQKPKNFFHIVFNNGAHDSVGGQPTVAFDINLPKIAESCGYNTIISAQNIEELDQILPHLNSMAAPLFFEIKVKKGNRKNLGRPTTTPLENKRNFMSFLKNEL